MSSRFSERPSPNTNLDHVHGIFKKKKEKKKPSSVRVTLRRNEIFRSRYDFEYARPIGFYSKFTNEIRNVLRTFRFDSERSNLEESINYFRSIDRESIENIETFFPKGIVERHQFRER